MLRALLIIAVIVLGLLGMGWLTINNSPSNATITIDKERVKADTQKAEHEVREFVEKVGENTQEAVDEIDLRGNGF